jgi:glycosyltransferase involved in cell wall biosynthesis
MRLAIDASRTTVARVTGTEQYAIQMIRALLRLNTQHPVTLYFRDAPAPHLFPRESIPRPDLLTMRVIPLRRAWTHVRFAAALAQDRPDWVWVPAHTLPFVFPGRAAVTVHDLGYRHFPHAHAPRQRAYLDMTTRTSSARAALIFADSRATADDLTRFYGTPPGKIEVVYPGVDAPVMGDSDAIRAKYGLPERYFLFIGTLQPRKNIARIVQAFNLWRAQSGDHETALVLAGGRGWLFDPAWIDGVDSVILPGYIDDADKGALYAGARALVFPSLYEGFGFPVLEAMLCGCPVITSTTSSLPELAGDAALLVDPLSVEYIAEAMRRVDNDEHLRAVLIDKGRVQAARFTWENAAHRLLELWL